MVTHQATRRELTWFYSQADSDLGIRCSGFERGPTSVWDERRNDSAHAARHTDKHRRNVDRHRDIAATLDRMQAYQRTVVASAFAPTTKDVLLRSAFAEADGAASLVDVALMTPAASETYRRAHGGHDGTRTNIREWLAAEALSLRPVRLGPMKTEAREMVRLALVAYENVKLELAVEAMDLWTGAA